MINTHRTDLNDRLTGIQLLRFVAAVMIVFYHSGGALIGLSDQTYVWRLPFIYDRGYYAVDLFFSISGFIICVVFDRSTEFSRLSFFFRRFWRIYPVYGIFCALAVFWFRAGLPQLGDDPGWDNILASVLILPRPDFPIYAVGWTLEHEVIFYCLAGILLPAIGKWGLLGVLLSLAMIGWVDPLDGVWDFHITSAAQLQFAAGVLAYLSYRKLGPLLPPRVWIFCGVALILTPEITLYDLNNHRLVIGLASCCLIFGTMHANWMRFPRLAAMINVAGDLTYSVYLVHWTLLPLIGIAASGLIPQAAEPYRFLAILAVFAVALGWHVFVERPLLRMGQRIEKVAQTLRLQLVAR